MSTPYETIFDSFLSKIEDDLYTNLDFDIESDMTKLMKMILCNSLMLICLLMKLRLFPT
jgi:hypothetical protein